MDTPTDRREFLRQSLAGMAGIALAKVGAVLPPVVPSVAKLTLVCIPGPAATQTSLTLPPAVPGLQLWVFNEGRDPIRILGTGLDRIDDEEPHSGVQQSPGSAVMFLALSDGQWYSEGLATVYGSAAAAT